MGVGGEEGEGFSAVVGGWLVVFFFFSRVVVVVFCFFQVVSFLLQDVANSMSLRPVSQRQTYHTPSNRTTH